MERRYGCGWAYRVAVALVCAGGLLHAGAGAIAAGKPATHTVVIDGTNYAPATLTVKRGDTVVWINKDPFPHTVTAKGVFDSHDIAASRSWKYTARKAGEFAYICTLHPTMKATLKVE
jgi:plastocyanin